MEITNADEELPLPLDDNDAGLLKKTYENVPTDTLKSWMEQTSGGLMEFISKRIEQRMWKVMKNTCNLGKEGQELSVSDRGLMQAQTEAYIQGLLYYKGIFDSVGREYGRRVRQKVGFNPDASARRSGVRTSRETLRNTREVFGDDFPVR
jgi:hypothetical protein